PGRRTGPRPPGAARGEGKGPIPPHPGNGAGGHDGRRRGRTGERSPARPRAARLRTGELALCRTRLGLVFPLGPSRRIRRMNNRLASVLCAVLALAACRKGEKSGPVVAEVGGEKITVDEVRQRLNETSPFLR